MAFTGKFMLESCENHEEFLKALGIHVPQDHGNEKITTEIYQNDHFSVTKSMKDKIWCNKFLIGKETELQTVNGEKFKTTVTLEEGKLKIHFPKYLYTAEVVGDKLIEVQTVGAVSAKMISKKTE